MSASGWTSFRATPDDLLFFRDGKPSTRGSDHYLRSLFPPYPSTLVAVRLVGAVVPGFVLVGGWDLARKQAKPLRRAILPGSVFLFEPTDGTGAAEAVARIDGQCFSDFSEDEPARQGFGVAVAGVSPQEVAFGQQDIR